MRDCRNSRPTRAAYERLAGTWNGLIGVVVPKKVYNVSIPRFPSFKVTMKSVAHVQRHLKLLVPEIMDVNSIPASKLFVRFWTMYDGNITFLENKF